MLPAASGAGVLSTDTDTPPVTETAMGTDLLHTFNVITKLGIEVLGEDLTVLSGLEILLSIQEPKRDLELTRVLDDSNELFNFISSELSSSLVHINFSLLADKIGETTSNTLDFGEAKNYVPLTLNVSVKNTKNVLKLRSLHKRRHGDGLLLLK